MGTRFLSSAIVIAVALLATAPARADVTAPDGRVIECFCTGSQGERYELGDIICLTVGQRSFMAKCVMAQNVPIWRDQQEGCLSSNLRLPDNASPRKGTTSVAHAAPMTPSPSVPAFETLRQRNL